MCASAHRTIVFRFNKYENTGAAPENLKERNWPTGHFPKATMQGERPWPPSISRLQV